MEELLSFDSNVNGFFNFQRVLSIDAIINETICLDRKAHLFWEIPIIDAKVNELMYVLSFSRDAKFKLNMTGDTKDAKTFFAVKKHELENKKKPELSFVDSLFMMFKLRKKIIKAQAECKAYDNIRQYTHNFGDYIFYKSMNFRSTYLKSVADNKNKELNQQARKTAAEYDLEVLLLQSNTLLFSCEKSFIKLINFRLFVDFILMVRSLANVIL